MRWASRSRPIALWSVVVGIVVTLIGLANLWSVELEGCDPDRLCRGSYAILWIGLTLMAAGAVVVLTALVVSRSRRREDARHT